MPEAESSASQDVIEVDLRDPKLAAFLAWLWPGAGHIYQRRYAKGVLFMVCILGTFFYGLMLGGGHCVYASWTKQDKRWQYFCQLGVGAPSLPAAVQTFRMNSDKDPLFVGNYYHRPQPPQPGMGENPKVFKRVAKEVASQKRKNGDGIVYTEAFMAPPGRILQDHMDLLALWHKEHTPGFELGTLFTVIAGLLNILAIYDAFAGPAAAADERSEQTPSTDKKKQTNKRAT